MKVSLFLIGSLLCLLTGCARKEATSPIVAGSSVFGVFEGITPCSAETQPLPQIPEDTNCEQMIWEFALFQDSATGAPTIYRLDAAYGVPKQNTTGLDRGGTLITMEGNWAIVKGTSADPDAVVYQLHPDDSQQITSFLKVDDNHLFLLDRELNALVGNALFSYTLSRTDKDVK
ncbi:MAG: copper resistance protein NlpE [Chloroflexota bacterium]|nr:copper resistance protein NlpE [Chloroflexota bacterium]